jgi:hypothetical protein
MVHIEVHALPNTLSMFWQSRPSDIMVARPQVSLQFETTSITFARTSRSLDAIRTKLSCKNNGDFPALAGVNFTTQGNPERPQVRTDSFELASCIAGFLVAWNSLFV